MKNVLYIGNALSKKGKNTTSIETLGKRLGDFCSIKTSSSKSNKILRLIDMVRQLVINRSWADYVLIDTYSTTNFYYAFIISQISRIMNVKYIPILHGGNLENRLKKTSRLSKMIFENAYRLVSPSKYLESIFKKYGYKNLEYIPNTIEIRDFKFFNRDIDIIKLFWLRSFASIYNPYMAILVLEELIIRGYNPELVMIGPEIDQSMKITKQLALEKSLNVKFTGKLSKNEWTELSKEYNIFINTTNFDNMPVSVIEAMALGLPVVSTDVGGLPFLINHTEDGLLVAPNNVKAMADSIIELKEDKNLKDKLVFNARQKVEKFDWEEIREKWEKLLI